MILNTDSEDMNITELTQKLQSSLISNKVQDEIIDYVESLLKVCKISHDAIIPVSDYGRIGSKDTEQFELQKAVIKLKEILK